MRNINEITTEQLREASSKGFVASLGYRSIADNEFDYWLVRERQRVAELAIAKERRRAVAIVMANIGKVVWQAKHSDEAIDMTEMYEALMKED